MLARHNRLTSSPDFQRVYSQGRPFKGRYGKLIVLNSRAKCPSRFGISVSKQVGGAVIRNKIKRQLRNILRSSTASATSGFDMVYVVWKAEVPFSDRSEEVSKLLALSLR